VPLETMIERFELSAVSRNPAVFDVAKLEWMSGHYLRSLTPEAFAAATLPLIEHELGRVLSPGEHAAIAAVAPLVQERAKRLTDVTPQVRFLLDDDLVADTASWEKVMPTADARLALDGAAAALTGLDTWSVATVESALRGMLAATGLSAGKGLQPIRVAVTGSAVSPPLFESLAALGRERSLRRIGDARARVGR
jgi:glutamyl-tRNA synthetase